MRTQGHPGDELHRLELMEFSSEFGAVFWVVRVVKPVTTEQVRWSSLFSLSEHTPYLA